MKQIVNSAVLSVVSALFLATIVIAPVSLAHAASADQVVTAKAASDKHIETRISKLRAELKITPAQEEPWSKVAEVMRENHKEMEELTKARAKNAKTMTAVEDLKSYSEISDAHAAGLKKFIPVFETLYASMSDEQKKNADTSFRSHSRKKSKGK
jgi:periplasmic protein CpxP/Spy